MSIVERCSARGLRIGVVAAGLICLFPALFIVLFHRGENSLIVQLSLVIMLFLSGVLLADGWGTRAWRWDLPVYSIAVVGCGGFLLIHFLWYSGRQVDVNLLAQIWLYVVIIALCVYYWFLWRRIRFSFLLSCSAVLYVAGMANNSFYWRSLLSARGWMIIYWVVALVFGAAVGRVLRIADDVTGQSNAEN